MAAVALACVLFALCAVRVTAQEIVHIHAGTFCHLDKLLEKCDGLHAAAVTLLPEGAVVWLDGKPLKPYQPVPLERLGQIYLFSAVESELGVTLCSKTVTNKTVPRIRSVNPYFSSETGQTVD